MSSKEFLDWAYNKIEIEFIQPGKPNQNAFIESFNSRLREEYLNEEGPHSSLQFKTPKEFEDEQQT